MDKIFPPKIVVTDRAENIVKNGSGILDHVMPLNHTCRLKSGESKAVNQFFKRHAVLKRLGCKYGKTVKKTFK